jgi:uncharacterized protein
MPDAKQSELTQELRHGNGSENPFRAPVSPRATSRLQPLGMRDVALTRGFWADAQARNGDRTIPHTRHWIEQVGTVENFRGDAPRRGVPFADSDVYKVLEAMAWELSRTGDASIGDDIEELAAVVAGALEDDGYLNTYWRERGERYVDLQMGHELYCFGHLIQAAVAAARAGGDGVLVDLGRRVADHVCDEFGPDGPRPRICGHPEIEMALVELYRLTDERRYLDTARAMIDRRGHGVLGEGEFGPAYYQDDVPIRDARVMHGHAVRALYLLIGALDVAVETGDHALLAAVERQWDATLARRTYITGGMGSRHRDESFGEDFELPNDRAYSETCAGVAAVMLAWRLLLVTGDTRYADQIERVLYNVVSACASQDGTAFFYTNPLQRRAPSAAPPADGESHEAATGMRAPWFTVPCCPPNLARLLASLGAYLATTDDDGIQLHQYASGTVRTERATLAVATDYPWDGVVEIAVEATDGAPWTLGLRVPEWARGATLTVDGQTRPVEPGPATVRRTWAVGDVVRLELPLDVRWTVPDPRIDAARGCVAVERGPLVYCAEALAAAGEADLGTFVVEPERAVPRAVDGLAGVVCLAVDGRELAPAEASWPYGARTGQGKAVERSVTLIPYYAWGNRGPSTMRVWLPLARESMQPGGGR